jgi:hypothetical protein
MAPKQSIIYFVFLAGQFRMEELILKFHLRGVALQYSGGFPTDVSECCIWLTPFVIPQDSWGDIR